MQTVAESKENGQGPGRSGSVALRLDEEGEGVAQPDSKMFIRLQRLRLIKWWRLIQTCQGDFFLI